MAAWLTPPDNDGSDAPDWSMVEGFRTGGDRRGRRTGEVGLMEVVVACVCGRETPNLVPVDGAWTPELALVDRAWKGDCECGRIFTLTIEGDPSEDEGDGVEDVGHRPDCTDPPCPGGRVCREPINPEGAEPGASR